MSNWRRASAMAAVLYILGLDVSTAAADDRKFRVETGPIASCKAPSKSTCVILHVTNIGQTQVRIPVVPPIGAVDDAYAVLESRPVGSPSSDWTIVFEEWGDVVSFPQRAQVEPRSMIDVLVVVPKLPKATRGHEFRISLRDESGVAVESNPFSVLDSDAWR